jgi:hypothetical protein
VIMLRFASPIFSRAIWGTPNSQFSNSMASLVGDLPVYLPALFPSLPFPSSLSEERECVDGCN